MLHRLQFCDAATQRRFFEAQLGLAVAAGLPLFLHMRAAAADFVDVMRRNAGGLTQRRRAGECAGVVHSFTGTREELEVVLALDPPLAIGASFLDARGMVLLMDVGGSDGLLGSCMQGCGVGQNELHELLVLDAPRAIGASLRGIRVAWADSEGANKTFIPVG